LVSMTAKNKTACVSDASGAKPGIARLGRFPVDLDLVGIDRRLFKALGAHFKETVERCARFAHFSLDKRFAKPNAELFASLLGESHTTPVLSEDLSFL
jgi:hypothetical protein